MVDTCSFIVSQIDNYPSLLFIFDESFNALSLSPHLLDFAACLVENWFSSIHEVNGVPRHGIVTSAEFTGMREPVSVLVDTNKFENFNRNVSIYRNDSRVLQNIFERPDPPVSPNQSRILFLLGRESIRSAFAVVGQG